MTQELLDSFKLKHEANEIGTATLEELKAVDEFFKEVGSEAAIEFFGNRKAAPKTKKAKK